MTRRALWRKPMLMRTGYARTGLALPLCAVLLLAGCNDIAKSPGESAKVQGSVAEKAAGEIGSRTISCGPHTGEAVYSCLLEVDDRKGDLYLTLRQPEGGFRRLVWPKDGILAPADGAEPLEAMALKGGGVEVRIGGWRYRIEKSGGGLP